MKTIEELCEFIWYLEEKYDLLDFEIEGVKVWQSMRMNIYFQLAQETGLFSLPHTKFTRKDIIRNSSKILFNCVFYNPLLLKKADILVISHPRTKLVDGEYIDIYTHYFINDLLQSGASLAVLELDYLGKHFSEPKSYKKYLDFKLVFEIVAKFFQRSNADSNEKMLANKVDDEIHQKYGIRINLLAQFMIHTRYFKNMYFLYSLILKKVKPNKVYLVVSYGKAALIQAAKDLNIRTIEFQHGTFSQYHLGYSYPKRSLPLAYFPDELYVWSDFWKKLIKFPIADENVKIFGFKYLELKKTMYSHINKQKDRVIFLSQGALGDSMAKLLLDNFDKFKHMDIKYKLHPGEYERWSSYLNLSKLSNYPNVEILTNCDLYSEFAKAEYQVGVFSTAIWEGVEFGCKTILFDLPGIENMKKFIELNGLSLRGNIYSNKEQWNA